MAAFYIMNDSVLVVLHECQIGHQVFHGKTIFRYNFLVSTFATMEKYIDENSLVIRLPLKKRVGPGRHWKVRGGNEVTGGHKGRNVT